MSRERWKYLIALVATVALGAASRLQHTGLGLLDKSAGDVLYAVAAYLCFALAASRSRIRSVALAALVACWSIELFQATGIPAQHADSAAVRWLVGTTFSWHDMAWYPIGVALAAALDRALATER